MYSEEVKKTIRIIEERYGITLEQKDEIEYMDKNCYQLDDKGEVIALNLRDNKITDITLLKELKNLRHLNLAKNQISDITPLKELKNLTELGLYQNQISDITPLKELKNLIELELDGNVFSDITSLKELTNLIKLSLTTNIESDYEILQTLPNLTKLMLYNSQIKDITPLKEFKNLTELFLYNNQISDITPLKEFKNLTVLFLPNNQISDITPLKELKKLIRLSLSNNQISDITPLKELKNLTRLSLSNNQISDITPLKELKNLIRFSLSNNQISDITPLIELNNLIRFSLSNNQIKIFPEELLDLNLDIKLEYHYSNSGIYLGNNPIEEPPLEIISQGNKAIREYFKRIKEEGTRELNELKVIFMGAGGSGKTSLIKRVLDNEFDKNENMTHGINIRRQKININDTEIKVHFWDFGGQEMMHSTHQFFLSHRSLYVVVLDGRKEENVEYWLNFIKSFGGDSPIIIVLNKIDDNRDFELNRKFLKEKYPNILDFFKTSCLDTEGISDFYDYLKESILDVEMIKTPWVKSWFDAKEHIENLNDNYIVKEDFNSICDEYRVEVSSRDVLSKYLDNLGVAIHFDDFKLDDIHTLNPEWITNGIYSIITSKVLSESRGELDISTLSQLLDHKIYPKYTHQYIIELMKKFELCYAIDDREILIPSALPKDSPKFEFDESQSLRFEFEYSFLPPSVISTFIVKSHEDIEDRLRWKEGVILTDSSTSSRAFIKVDMQDKRIFIYVNGEQKRDFFAIIRKRFHDINSKFKEIEITEWIPLPNYPKHRVEYQTLIGHEIANKPNYFDGKLRMEFSVSQLLSGIESQSQTNQAITKITNNYNGEVTMGNTFSAGGNITGVAIGNHNKIDVKISTTNNELKQLLQTFQQEANKVVETLPDDEKEEFIQDVKILMNDANKGKKSKYFDTSIKSLETFNSFVGFGESLSKIVDWLGKLF